VAKETLEGNLRGVIAQLTPEQINEEKTRFQQALIDEGERDLHRLGLVLDNLKLQNISDEVGYLNSIGRIREAEVRRSGRIGEVRAQADAAVNEAQNWERTELAKVETEIQVSIKENEKRLAHAVTQRDATIAEVRGQVHAQTREAEAQLEAWRKRIERERKRLEADVVVPARARRQQSELGARAQAAEVLAQGRAAADALAKLAEAYRQSGPRARDALVLQKLVPVFDQLAGTLQEFKVDRLTVLGAGGSSNSFGGAVVSANEQIRAATGVDLMGKFKTRTNAE
jgi:flotillin